MEKGGVAVFVKKELFFTKCDFKTTNIEFTGILVETHLTFLLVTIYRSPVYPIHLFCDNLKQLLSELDTKGYPVMVLGDLNDDIKKIYFY